MPLPKTRRVLEAFASRNLLDIRISDDVRYRLRAGTPELARGLGLLIEAYRRTPALVREWAVGIT